MVLDEDMTKKLTYGEQLKHPNWQRKRLNMLEAAGWKCTQCDAEENTLHVHHKHYVKGRMAWEYEDAELVVLCDQCHLSEHALKDLLGEMLSASTAWDSTRAAVGLVGGYMAANYELVGCSSSDRAQEAMPAMFLAGVIAHAMAILPSRDIAAFIREANHKEFPGVPLGPVLEQALAKLENWG